MEVMGRLLPFCYSSTASTLQPNVEVSGEAVVLRSVTTLNNAVYQCNASNQYGYLLANAFVNVLRKFFLTLNSQQSSTSSVLV